LLDTPQLAAGRFHLAVRVYRVTEAFPPKERYDLTSQIRRAAVSIPSNIAEGQARGTDPAFANHLDIALGSAAELETQLTIALKIGYIQDEPYNALVTELGEITRMIYGLLKKVRPPRR
jgi:four helix bundle protein